jgi:5-methyltetrahydropteroyltriglutamate--homocysteine methyltransferase
VAWISFRTRKSAPGDVRLTNFANRRDWTAFGDAYADPTGGIANMKVAMKATGFEEGFITAVSPGSAARVGNAFHKTEEEIIYACADALREEYTAIIDAGLILQIDDPSIAENFDQIVPEPSIEDYRRFTQIRVDALNHALRGLPADRIRFHLCWGSWHGPHTTDIEFRHIVDLMLQINDAVSST